MADREEGTARPIGVMAAAALLGASVLLSRVLGYAREAVLAHQVGASAATDAYYAAFQIPDLLNYFLAGGALSIAFLPMYARARAAAGEAAAERLLALVLGTMGAIAVVLTAVLWWKAGALVRLQFPRFDPETQALTARLTRIVLPAQIFFVTGGIVRAALMARGRFATQALAPLLYNGAIIAGGLALGPRLGVEGFAWGALVGAALGPLLVPLLDARMARLRVGLRIDPSNREFRRYLVVAAPLMFGLTLLTVDEWYDRWFGGLLDAGTVAHLSYARRLMQLPVAVVGQAIATAALPALAAHWNAGRRVELDRVVLGSLRVGLGLAVVAAATFVAFADPIVEIVYRHGAFTSEDAARVSRLLAIFALAVPAWITQQIAARAFFARGDTWRPMLLGTGVAVVAVPLYLALGRRLGADGLAVSGVVAMSANALLTLVWARRLHGGPRLGPLAATGARAAAIAAAAAAAGAGLAPGRNPWIDLAVGGAIFAAVAGAGIWWLGDAPLREALRRALARLRRGG